MAALTPREKVGMVTIMDKAVTRRVTLRDPRHWLVDHDVSRRELGGWCIFVRAVIAKHHKLGGLNTIHLLSHSSGGRKS